MRATMSVAGLYTVDNTLFDDFALPSNMNKENIVDNILYETMELESAISDPYVLKWAIGKWSTRMLPIWTKLQATLNLSYNPIENYNMTEQSTDQHYISSTDVTSGGDTVNHYGAGFNSADTQANVPGTRDTTTLGSTITHGGNDTLTHNFSRHGNIGVTTSQQMITQEREVAQFNLIELIINEFKEQFCLLVY